MPAIAFSSVAGGFLLELAVRSTLVVLLFAFALWLFRIRDVTLRYMTWRLVLFAMLLLPVASLLIPGIPLPARAGSSANFVFPLRSVFDVPLQIAPPPIGEGKPDSPASPALQSEAPGPRWVWFAIILYFSVAGAMMMRITLGLWIMRRKAEEFERLEDSRLLERVNEQTAKLELPVFPELRESAGVAVPVTFGWKKPLILLPADWPEWPTEMLDLVLAHELSHIQRGDYLIRILSALNKSLYWFHPAGWWLDKHLAELSEQLSDDAALRACGQDRERYAKTLRDFMNRLERSPAQFRLGIAMSVSSRGDRRLQRILDSRRSLAASLSFARKAAVFVLSTPVLIFLARAEPQDQLRTRSVAQAQLAQVDSGPAQPRPARVPTPVFSQAYVEALQGILEMEPGDAQALEQVLQTEPEAWTNRLRLLAYYMRGDQIGLPESFRQRGKHVLWLIERQPGSEILASPMGVSEGVLTPDEEQRATRLWEKNLQDHPSDARVFWNAAQFMQGRDESARLQHLRRAAALAPENRHYGLGLGTAYGEQLVASLHAGNEATAASILHELQTTTNPAILEPVVHILQSEYNRSLMLGREQAIFRDKASHLFARLEALNPDVDRTGALPQITPEMKGMLAPGARLPDDFQARFDAAEREIRRLPSSAFPQLPQAIAAVLGRRGCLIPQPMPEGAASNVIQGEFFRQGQTGWAVLCSVSGNSSILVFRNDSDTNPTELAQAEDRGYLQGNGGSSIIYSRQITAVDQRFIVRHYRAYGGPEPPPIDHNGIDNAFLGKASVTWYHHSGEWLRLTGAD